MIAPAKAHTVAVSVLYTADDDGSNPRIVGLETPLGTLGDAHMDALSAIYYVREPVPPATTVLSQILENLARCGLVDARRAPDGLLTVRRCAPTPLGARIARQL